MMETIFIVEEETEKLSNFSTAMFIRENMVILSRTMREVSKHLYIHCGWSSLHCFQEEGEEEGEEEGGEEGGEEGEEEMRLAEMLVRLIFWDSLPPAALGQNKNGQKIGWYKRPRPSAQQDAWLSLELLSTSLPESVFEMIVERCLWPRYVTGEMGGGIGGSGGDSSDKSNEVGAAAEREMKRGSVRRAAVAMCGNLAVRALERCQELDADDASCMVDAEITNTRRRLVLSYPDVHEKKELVRRACVLVERMKKLRGGGGPLSLGEEDLMVLQIAIEKLEKKTTVMVAER